MASKSSSSSKQDAVTMTAAVAAAAADHESTQLSPLEIREVRATVTRFCGDLWASMTDDELAQIQRGDRAASRRLLRRVCERVSRHQSKQMDFISYVVPATLLVSYAVAAWLPAEHVACRATSTASSLSMVVGAVKFFICCVEFNHMQHCLELLGRI